MTIKNTALILLAIGIAFWFPITRAAILFVLPLGSGIDDLVFIVAASIGAFLFALSKRDSLPYHKKSRWTFVVVLVGVFIVFAIILSMFT